MDCLPLPIVHQGTDRENTSHNKPEVGERARDRPHGPGRWEPSPASTPTTRHRRSAHRSADHHHPQRIMQHHRHQRPTRTADRQPHRTTPARTGKRIAKRRKNDSQWHVQFKVYGKAPHGQKDKISISISIERNNENYCQKS